MRTGLLDVSSPMPSLASGLVAFPYEWEPPWMQPYNTMLLDEMERHPLFYAQPSTPEERRASAAMMLTDSTAMRWGVWRSGEFLGLLYLSQVTPGHDATVHFLFLDHNLVGKRGLLKRFLGYCLHDLGFRRLSALIPEDAKALIALYRKLGFQYEGESRATGLTPTAFLAAGAPGLRPIADAPAWLAHIGSRSEVMYWRDDHWIDVMRLRLLKAEWGSEPDASSSPRSSRSPSRRSDSRESPRPEPEHYHSTTTR